MCMNFVVWRLILVEVCITLHTDHAWEKNEPRCIFPAGVSGWERAGKPQAVKHAQTAIMLLVSPKLPNTIHLQVICLCKNKSFRKTNVSLQYNDAWRRKKKSNRIPTHYGIWILHNNESEWEWERKEKTCITRVLLVIVLSPSPPPPPIHIALFLLFINPPSPFALHFPSFLFFFRQPPLLSLIFLFFKWYSSLFCPSLSSLPSWHRLILSYLHLTNHVFFTQPISFSLNSWQSFY